MRNLLLGTFFYFWQTLITSILFYENVYKFCIHPYKDSEISVLQIQIWLCKRK